MFTLIIGGAASGKSEFAERHALKLTGWRIYLATMEPLGVEGRVRVERHRRQRTGKGFETVERYTNLAGLLLPPNTNILLECLGNLTANELYSPPGRRSGRGAGGGGPSAVPECAPHRGHQ